MLIDFIIGFTSGIKPESEGQQVQQQHEVWILYVNEASNHQRVDIGVNLETPY